MVFWTLNTGLFWYGMDFASGIDATVCGYVDKSVDKSAGCPIGRWPRVAYGWRFKRASGACRGLYGRVRIVRILL